MNALESPEYIIYSNVCFDNGDSVQCLKFYISDEEDRKYFLYVKLNIK